jgi:hypothetical protein
VNQLLEWLAGGDLRSDGLSDEAAAFVLAHPYLFKDLFEGFSAKDDVIRGRAADALEKVARFRPDLVVEVLPEVVQIAREDSLPMVQLHVAMTLGHLAVYEERVDEIVDALLVLLDRQSVFARSWAIASLCIVGLAYPERQGVVVESIAAQAQDPSAAIRARVRKAMAALTQEGVGAPRGWIKSEGLKHLEG